VVHHGSHWPSSDANAGLPTVASAALESSHVLKATPGNLYKLSTIIGATSGYLMLFDATAAPANGAVAPVWSQLIESNGTNGGLLLDWGEFPMTFNNGIVVVFSSTGPFNLTASATAAFFGAVK
jgi:hypothetical protein